MKKITIFLLAIAAVSSGCRKFTNINNNPNQPTVVTPNVVLSAALVASASNLGDDFQSTARWMGYWSRSGSYIEDVPTETYAIQPTYKDGEFQSLYSVLTKYNYIEHNSGGDPFYVGVAKTMKALHFSTLVDGFGNVPYSQAFNLNQYPTPKYDDAAGIYASLILQCDSAVTYFQQAITYYSAAPGSVTTLDDKYDVMYGRGAGVDPTTRVNEWITFCNTVKLKLLMTVRQAGGTFTNSYITAEIAKVTANGEGYIQANASASVNPGYTTSSAAQQNPLYGSFYTPAGEPGGNLPYYRANEYYVVYGNTNNDFRFTDDYAINLSAAPYVTGNYDGDPLAVSNALSSIVGQSTQPSTVGPLKSSTQDQFIMSDFEALFWQAEAAQEGYITGTTASAFVQEGTEQSFVYVNDTGDGVAADNIADADNYIAANAGNPLVDPTAGGLQAVITQKWSALNAVNWEQAYTDYRRTGYPVPDGTNFGFSHANNIVPHSSPDVTGAPHAVNIPYRYLYPQSEINTNGKNIPTGVTAYTPIFWDVREK
jgi:hypothetical protein